MAKTRQHHEIAVSFYAFYQAMSRMPACLVVRWTLMKERVEDVMDHRRGKTFVLKMAGNLRLFLRCRQVLRQLIEFFHRRLLRGLNPFLLFSLGQQRTVHVGRHAFACQFLCQSAGSVAFGQPLANEVFRICRIVDVFSFSAVFQNLLHNGF